MKPQLVIFDWAGTTVDYGCFAPVNAFALAFQKFGVTPTVEEIRAPMGMLKRDHIRTMLAMPAIRQQWEEKQARLMKRRWKKFTASLKTRSWRASPSMPRPNPVCWKPCRTQRGG